MLPISRDEFTEIISSSPIRPRLRRELRYVPEEITDWENRDFLAVTNKSRTEGVIVSLERDRVVPFRFQARTPNASGRVEAIICDICTTWQQGTHSFALTLEKERKSVSYLVCADLHCSLHVRDKTNEAKLSRVHVREYIDKEARVERLRRKLKTILNNYAKM